MFTLSFRAFATNRIDSALAVANFVMASASPLALLICSNWLASDTKIFDFFSPSALLNLSKLYKQVIK